MGMERLNKSQALHELVGQSLEMRRLLRMIPRVAFSQHPVLLLGESGTGKSTIARAIHSQGPFAERPFLVVDCESASPALVESLLFAHATGRPKQELASVAGAVFFKEVWAMSPALQAKFVRALQERDVRHASGRRDDQDARILVASSRDLELAVQQGTFRHDLYSRVSAVSLRLPALRERRQDIGLLAEHFLERLGADRGKRYFISPEALKTLQEHDWPGNLRELKDCLGYACAACSGSVLQPEDLPLKTPDAGAASSVDGASSLDAGRILPLAEVEKQTILHALERFNGDKVMTARVLGIGKTTLYRKLKEYGVSQSWVGRPATSR